MIVILARRGRGFPFIQSELILVFFLLKFEVLELRMQGFHIREIEHIERELFFGLALVQLGQTFINRLLFGDDQIRSVLVHQVDDKLHADLQLVVGHFLQLLKEQLGGVAVEFSELGGYITRVILFWNSSNVNFSS